MYAFLVDEGDIKEDTMNTPEKNLLQETLKELKKYHRTEKDVLWVGSESFGWFTWKDFEELADTEYNSGHGTQEVACDLLIVGRDFWLERKDYDGAECWTFKTMPSRPENYRKPVVLTVTQARKKFRKDIRGWATLTELHDTEIWEDIK